MGEPPTLSRGGAPYKPTSASIGACAPPSLPSAPLHRSCARRPAVHRTADRRAMSSPLPLRLGAPPSPVLARGHDRGVLLDGRPRRAVGLFTLGVGATGGSGRRGTRVLADDRVITGGGMAVIGGALVCLTWADADGGDAAAPRSILWAERMASPALTPISPRERGRASRSRSASPTARSAPGAPGATPGLGWSRSARRRTVGG